MTVRVDSRRKGHRMHIAQSGFCCAVPWDSSAPAAVMHTYSTHKYNRSSQYNTIPHRSIDEVPDDGTGQQHAVTH